MGDGRAAYKVFFGGVSEGNKPLRRPRRRWDDNIKNVSLRNVMERHGLDSSSY